jgi:hypothetical protein
VVAPPSPSVLQYGVIPHAGDVDAEQSNTGSRLAPPRRDVEVAIVNIDDVDS